VAKTKNKKTNHKKSKTTEQLPKCDTAELEKEIETLLQDIERLKAEMDRMRPLSPTMQAKLRENFLIKYTYNSNAIEGNSLTLNETALVVLHGMTIGGKPIKDHLEALGHSQAFVFMVKMVENKTAMTEETIKSLHYYVMRNDDAERGNYRTSNVEITGTDPKLPQWEDVPKEIETILDHIRQSKLHTIEKAAEAHVDFERTHPFVDGNGRTGRLLLNFILMENGYLPVDIKNTDKLEYYDALRGFDEQHTYAPMIKLIAKYEQEEIMQRLSIFAKKSKVAPP
jgi:Fic family protein